MGEKKMNFKDKYELQEWLGNALNEKFGKSLDGLSGETNDVTGRCDIILEFPNGDVATLSIEMDKA